jgi:hypothetical protein
MKRLAFPILLIALLVSHCTNPAGVTSTSPARTPETIDTMPDPYVMRAKWEAHGIECYEMVIQKLVFLREAPILVRVEKGVVVAASRLATNPDGTPRAPYVLTGQSLHRLATIDTLFDAAQSLGTPVGPPSRALQISRVWARYDPAWGFPNRVDRSVSSFGTHQGEPYEVDCMDCGDGYQVIRFTPLACP